MTKRIAIQLYGHLRSYKQTYKSIFDNIVNANPDVKFDIFIHTWDELDSIQVMPHYEKDKKIAGLKLYDNEIEEVKDLYKPKKLIVEKQLELSDVQISRTKELNYDINLSQANLNVCHSFCSVNRLRLEYEKENSIVYDLVITTRPDIVYYDSLRFTPFYEKTQGWHLYNEDEINNRIFSTYINGVLQVINSDVYVPGIDLLLLSTPSAMDKIAKWEDNITEYINIRPEFAICKMIKYEGLKHSYFVYEKDKCWTILRYCVGGKTCLLQTFAEFLYNKIKRFLINSKTYCRNTYLNVTTYKSKETLEQYINNHLK